MGLTLLILLLLCSSMQLGCEPQTPAANLPTVQVRIGDNIYTLEIADTDALRERGLMKRDSMPRDRGMLFVFGQEEPLSFWMKNTRIPLDILYLDAQGKVVSIHSMQPYNLRPTPSAAPAKFAIELNQGEAQAAGVLPGDVIQIPTEVQTPREP